MSALPFTALAAVAAIAAPAQAQNDVRIMFEAGSAELDASAQERLDAFAAGLPRTGRFQLAIAGHADPAETTEPSEAVRLSQDRANAVRDYLVEKGVTAQSVTIQAFGADAPARRGTEEGRHRRVQVLVIRR